MKPLKPFNISFSGFNLVEASAGTGKTYNITSLYIRALIELELEVGNLLVVTYTEAATKELKDRLLKRIRESISVLKDKTVADDSDQFLKELLVHIGNPEEGVHKLQKAVRNFDEAAIYTIHGFCYQSLQEQAFESRAMYDAEMIGDDSELVQEAIDDYWRNWTAGASNDEQKKLLMNLLVENGNTPESLASELGPYIGKPYLTILPKEEISLEDTLKKLSKLKETFQSLQKIWSDDRDKIASLLLADELNGRKYRKDYVANWVGYMDEFLYSDFDSIVPFKQFDNFTETVLTENLNKGYTTPPAHRFFELADQYLKILETVLKHQSTFKKELLLDLLRTMKAKKEDQQVLSYDDLLLKLRDALLDKKQGNKLADKIRTKYPVALVDEFQDTDPNQYEIFRQIYKGHEDTSSLFMIGDPKQSIYSFRGADIFSYIEARRDAPDANVFNLDKNFRSSPRLLEGLNKLWDNHENPFILDDISFNKTLAGKDSGAYASLIEHGEEYPSVRFRLFSDNPDNSSKTSLASVAAEDTAREIKRLIEHGNKNEITIGKSTVKAKDIAVLVRTHKQADLMREALQKKGVKSVQYSQESVFKSDEAYHLEVFLKAVAEPSNESLIKTALSLPLTTFRARDLLDIEDDDKRWLEVLEKFVGWNRQWHEQGFATMFRSLLQEAKISEHVITLANGERILTNILHLGELIQNEARKNKSSQHGLIKWLSRKRNEEWSHQDEEQLRLESDEELVKIVTMHRSKGLEYPIVFCPFLWYGPNYSDSGQPLVYHNEKQTSILDLGGKQDDNRNKKRFLSNLEDLAESLRLAYVAMTRAKNCLYLSWSYADYSEFSALGYLFQKPKEVEASLAQKLGDDTYNKQDGANIEEAINKICDEYPQLFTSESDYKNISSQLLLSDDRAEANSEAREFLRKSVESGFKISSFSSLSSRLNDDPDIPDYDQFLNISFQEESVAKKSIFTFPRGPQPGTCIHKIFEEIDFQNPTNLNEVVLESLDSYGIDSGWHKIIEKNIRSVFNKKLLNGSESLCLSSVGEQNRIPELEFYFKSDKTSLRELLSIIRQTGSIPSNLEGHSEAGFLKGFIDLTFKHNGRYYLLDYKTNHLGDGIQDYSQEHMAYEIYHHMYDLQYHIYAIALHRFLEFKLPGYTYDSHFGGAFYLFVRGINEKGREGIFFDRPEESVIKKLDLYLSGGNNG